MKLIIQNEIECKKCGDRIFSAHRHDYKSCKCGAVSVDGGMNYLRRIGDLGSMIDHSMYMEEDTLKAIIDAVKWGRETNRNDMGIALAVVRALREHNLIKEDQDL